MGYFGFKSIFSPIKHHNLPLPRISPDESNSLNRTSRQIWKAGINRLDVSDLKVYSILLNTKTFLYLVSTDEANKSKKQRVFSF